MYRSVNQPIKWPIPQPTSVLWLDPKMEFRKSTNEIEGKEWYEMDISKADTIVIICEGKHVELDKRDFLQRIGLEW